MARLREGGTVGEASDGVVASSRDFTRGLERLEQEDRVDGTMNVDHARYSYDSTVNGATVLSHSIEPSDQAFLSPATLTELVEVWWKEYQPWCPILDQPTLTALLDQVHPITGIVNDVVLKALLALTISHSSRAISLGYAGRRRLSARFRAEAVLDAIAETSHRSVQALLIIVLHDYGSDNISSAGSLLSICKRMCKKLGFPAQLKTLINENLQTSVGSPPLEFWTAQGPDMSLYLMTLSLHTALILGSSWNSEAGEEESDYLFVPEELATPSFLDAEHVMLSRLNVAPSFKSIVRSAAICSRPKALYQQEEGYEQSFHEQMYADLSLFARYAPDPSYTLHDDGSVTFDSVAVQLATASNASIIILYQPHLATSTGQIGSAPGDNAKSRCLDACEQMIRIMSNVGDFDIEFLGPFQASRLFVAARFQLVVSQASSQSLPAGFDVLMHAINMCGRRWPLARRLDIVLRAALVEADSPSTMPLPAQFFDLNLSALEIDDILKQWVNEFKSLLYVGSLNGAYA